MNHNFKPGDLALVISGGYMGETAELVRFVLPGEVVVSPGTGKKYQFRPAAGIGGWMCSFRGEWAIKHEKNLMPLRGNFVPAEQQSKAVLA
ncbi:hypothetical protein EQV97_22510 [Pseudomonas sp. TMW22090]|uniref:hypothetical protein n=1 Tax=Pseudomonas sp. TMW22090 TaxID=2506434 RepID=UPI001F0E0429|nr:hypothetical protein [Pseudomonas sp. TMW22090]MCH4880136.1 hypothetical protein [Pseudomonas sp. TMW22090]